MKKGWGSGLFYLVMPSAFDAVGSVTGRHPASENVLIVSKGFLLEQVKR